MSFDRRWGGVAVAVLVLGCNGAQESHLPPPPPCKGMFCGTPSGGVVGATGSGGATTGTGTGTGTGSAIDVTGTVSLVASPDFDFGVATPFNGKATIVGVGPGGKTVSAAYGGGAGGAGGGAGTSFTLDGVDSGPAWLVVQDDTNGGAGILSTYSFQNLTSLTAVNLPVIDLDNLQGIADGLPSLAVTGVATGASQVVLQVVDGMHNPYPGVTLSGNPAGGTIVYDIGDGIYDDSATMTGSGGTIIVFNGDLSGNATFHLSYTSASTMMPATASITLLGSPGAATIGAVQLD